MVAIARAVLGRSAVWRVVGIQCTLHELRHELAAKIHVIARLYSTRDQIAAEALYFVVFETELLFAQKDARHIISRLSRENV